MKGVNAMGLSPEQIRSILNASSGRKSTTDKSKGYYFTRNESGTLDMNYGKPKADEVGRFTGKVGSVRRSRRGVATRMPNGSRRYDAGKLSQDLTSEVVAYKV